MDKNVLRKIDEFISAQSYDWSDVDVNVEVVKCSNYLEKFGFVKDEDYSIDYLIGHYNCIIKDIEEYNELEVEFDPDDYSAKQLKSKIDLWERFQNKEKEVDE